MSGCKFKPGDRVKCVDALDSDGILDRGEAYEVEHTMGDHVQLVGRPGSEWWMDARFTLNSPDPTVEEWNRIMAANAQGRDDVVQMPPHYRHLPVECIDVTEHFTFCAGNAVKYLWRHQHKGNPIQDLEKAAWYIKREIERLKREQ